MKTGAAIGEKRREPRRKASGGVRVRFHNPQPMEFEGSLIDLSLGGFRILHDCPSLESGAIVEFSHSAGAGRARVMWNRVLGNGIETGFLVIP